MNLESTLGCPVVPLVNTSVARSLGWTSAGLQPAREARPVFRTSENVTTVHGRAPTHAGLTSPQRMMAKRRTGRVPYVQQHPDVSCAHARGDEVQQLLICTVRYRSNICHNADTLCWSHRSPDPHLESGMFIANTCNCNKISWSEGATTP